MQMGLTIGTAWYFCIAYVHTLMPCCAQCSSIFRCTGGDSVLLVRTWRAGHSETAQHKNREAMQRQRNAGKAKSRQKLRQHK